MPDRDPRNSDIPIAPSFETWLQIGLQRLYDRTLSEPVPEELLRLVPQNFAAGSKHT